jgi:hypothetical protein
VDSEVVVVARATLAETQVDSVAVVVLLLLGAALAVQVAVVVVARVLPAQAAQAL